jgi:hypothetical protein
VCIQPVQPRQAVASGGGAQAVLCSSNRLGWPGRGRPRDGAAHTTRQAERAGPCGAGPAPGQPGAKRACVAGPVRAAGRRMDSDQGPGIVTTRGDAESQGLGPQSDELGARVPAGPDGPARPPAAVAALLQRCCSAGGACLRGRGGRFQPPQVPATRPPRRWWRRRRLGRAGMSRRRWDGALAPWG